MDKLEEIEGLTFTTIGFFLSSLFDKETRASKERQRPKQIKFVPSTIPLSAKADCPTPSK